LFSLFSFIFACCIEIVYEMKTGDKVRFLNAVGGGVVRGFKNKDIVWVEEEDGFQTPALIKECIVIEQDKTSVKSPEKPNIVKPEPVVAREEKAVEIVEFAGKDRLNVYLAYLPLDIKMLGKCAYEVFLINDSNYFLYLNYMNRENNAWKSRFADLIEPNTRLFMEEFSKEQINDLERICVQFIAFKKDKPFSLKNACNVELRIDGVKFYKLHCFRENDFFEDEALIYPLVVNDQPKQELLISSSDWQDALSQKANADSVSRKPAPLRKEKTQAVVEVDLHINQLLDTTAGMSNTDMMTVQLDKFRQTMEENKTRKGQKIVFIHGKGEGVLRNAILAELKLKYKNFPVQDASFKEYGFGATMVTVR